MERLLNDSSVFDAFTVGKVVTIYRNNSLPKGTAVNQHLSKMLPVDRAAVHGEPDEIARRLMETQWDMPMNVELREAAAVNLGESGYVWRLKWGLTPTKGGMTGTPLEYRAYVASDGSRLTFERVFCDTCRVANLDDGTEGWLFSHLPFTEFFDEIKQEDVLHGDEIQLRAGQKLKETVATHNGESPAAFRFRDQSLIEVPIKQRHDGTIISRKLWTVNFISGSTDKPAVLELDPLTIWVTTDGRVSELTFDQWSLSPSKDGE